MAAGLGWMSDPSSSLEITVISILFVAVCITLYTLCTSCYSYPPKAPHYPAEKEIPSSFATNEKPEDHWSTNRTSGNEHVPDRPHTRSYTMVQPQLSTVYSHNRAESHGYFSQGMIPQLSDAPVFSGSPSGSVNLDSSLFLSTFRDSGLWEELTMQFPSLQQPITVLKDHETQDTEDQTNVKSSPWLEPSNEHLYESIGIGRVSEPSSSHQAPEDQQSENSEDPYETVRDPRDPAAGHVCKSSAVMDNKVTDNPGQIFQPFPARQDSKGLVGSEITDVYAAVNFKKKSLKIKELPVSSDTIAQAEDDIDEEPAPPVPEKMFETDCL
ncbi:hypothetical protein AMEX_G1343 [Astyanax mexicanus]|uniref:Uncharacterized protein n=1 Tax=Astyanax mexicanus TaxID=7994 RepID=A0A8T2MHJ5_ASTMX|nr:hypothetical protein AMEX_G1343 [Astyanax mexicanus]